MNIEMIPNICESFLNESKASAVTKNSAEKDFKEYNIIFLILYRISSMINLVRDEKGNSKLLLLITTYEVSSLSLSKNDHSISMLSNQEIWSINQNKDDSKGFIEQIEILKNKFPLKNKIADSKINNEDYDDEEIDENVRPVKTEHLDTSQKNMMKLNKIILTNLNGNNNTSNNLINSNVNINSNGKLTHNKSKANTKENSKMNSAKNSKKSNFEISSNLLIQQPRIRGSGDQYATKQKMISNFPTGQNAFIPAQSNTPNGKPPIQRELNFNTMPNMLPLYQNQILPPSQFPFPNPNQKYPQQQPFIQPQFFPQTQYPMTMPNFAIQNEVRRQPPNTKPLQSQNTMKEDTKKIIIDNIIMGKDKRTTLMLRNIPNKYTLANVVEEINQTFWAKFDYVNLPIDYERKLNLGYAFVNFVDPFHIILFYELYHNRKWSKYHSDKKMDMTYADKQGKKDINCKDEQTYYAIEDRRFNFSQLTPKLEIPICHLEFFKKIYVNSVCVVDDKNGLYNDKCFVVKHFGKK